MLRLENENYTRKFTISIWLLMAFQAGYVNIGALMTSGFFVSHVTGTASRIGLGVAEHDSTILFTFVTILVSFIIGASIPGHFIGTKIENKREPQYVFVTGLKAFFFGLVLLLSELKFSQSMLLYQDQISTLILFLLSFCCGMQNSTCSISTNGFLKPTHMTGLSTDLGIGLAKFFAPKSSEKDYTEEKRKFKLRLSILLTFIFGGVVSTMIFESHRHFGFLFPFASSLCFLGMSVLKDIRNHSIESLSFKMFKATTALTFITTLLFGITAYSQS